MALTRRRFLRHGLTIVATGSAIPYWLQGLAMADPVLPQAPARDGRILVVLQMSGGNDGLNMVVPYADPLYRANRPTIGILDTDVLHLDNSVGLNPGMTGIKSLFDRGRLAVVQNVGYPNPNHSHFRSMDIWHTAAPDRIERTGWLGRCLDSTGTLSGNSLTAVNLGVEVPKALAAHRSTAFSVTDVMHFGLLSAYGYVSSARGPEDLLREIEKDATSDTESSPLRVVQHTTLDGLDSMDRVRDGVKNYHSTIAYPLRNPLANGLQQAAKLIAANLGIRILYVSTGGFDTHAREKDQHDLLMKRMDDALTAFYQDLEQMGVADRVLLMTFSEFGRRVHENGSAGTDHGTAGPMLLVGGAVNGGVYGHAPNLADLDRGDLKFETDFRSVYATVLQNWIGSDAGQILGADYPTLKLV